MQRNKRPSLDLGFSSLLIGSASPPTQRSDASRGAGQRAALGAIPGWAWLLDPAANGPMVPRSQPPHQPVAATDANVIRGGRHDHFRHPAMSLGSRDLSESAVQGPAGGPSTDQPLPARQQTGQ
jgi:hypothetical protein